MLKNDSYRVLVGDQMNRARLAEIEYENLLAKQDAQEILALYKKILNAHYEVQEVILFGSRARGDNRIESDIDVAVIFAELPASATERRKLAGDLFDLAWDLQLESGLRLSPLPMTSAELKNPELMDNPQLGRAISSEGIQIP
jgi:predicted nucleotidyltransferase